MPLEIPLTTFCAYLTETDGLKWRNDDFTACKMVKAIKGDKINGYFEIGAGASQVRYYESDSDKFAAICHRPLVKAITDKFTSPISIVPIPSSKTTLANPDRNFRTKSICERLASSCGIGYECSPILLFKREMDSSRMCGSRSPYHLEDSYHVEGKTNSDIILFDDVVTTGNHFKAAAWKLTALGMNVVGAIAFGRSVKEQLNPPLQCRTEMLDISKDPTLWDFPE